MSSTSTTDSRLENSAEPSTTADSRPEDGLELPKIQFQNEAGKLASGAEKNPLVPPCSDLSAIQQRLCERCSGKGANSPPPVLSEYQAEMGSSQSPDSSLHGPNTFSGCECSHPSLRNLGSGPYEDDWSKIYGKSRFGLKYRRKSERQRKASGRAHGQDERFSSSRPGDALDLRPWTRCLVQCHVGHYGPALGWSALTSLWRTLSQGFPWLTPPVEVSIVLWFITAILLVGFTVIYIVRCMLFPAGLKHDLSDYRRVNFFGAPLIATTNLLLNVPPFMNPNKTALIVMFYVCLSYQTLMAVFIYSEWIFGSSKTFAFVHPLYQMAVIGFFVLTILGSGLSQLTAAMFCYSVGVLFLAVVFFTLFQRLAERYKHHVQLVGPTMFLFLAPPAAAAIATWAIIISHGGEPGTNGPYFFSDFFFYTDLFIYMLLIRLLPEFWSNKFSIVWWAYVFPMLTAATAGTNFASRENVVFWNLIVIIMAIVGTLACLGISCVTLYFIWTHKIPDDEESLAECVRVREQAAQDKDQELISHAV